MCRAPVIPPAAPRHVPLGVRRGESTLSPHRAPWPGFGAPLSTIRMLTPLWPRWSPAVTWAFAPAVPSLCGCTAPSFLLTINVLLALPFSRVHLRLMCRECLRDIVPCPVARRTSERGLSSFLPLGCCCPAPTAILRLYGKCTPGEEPWAPLCTPGPRFRSPAGAEPAPAPTLHPACEGAESRGRPFILPSLSESSLL